MRNTKIMKLVVAVVFSENAGDRSRIKFRDTSDIKEAMPSREEAADRVIRNLDVSLCWLAKENSCSNVTEIQPIMISSNDALYSMLVGELSLKLISLTL